MKVKKVKSEDKSILKRTVKNITQLEEQRKLRKVKTTEAEDKDKAKAAIKKCQKLNKLSITRNRGIVYIGHIPHGFYETQMKDFFQQFGRVTKVRVSRSKNTGQSKGYAYVEFLYPEVAQIVAETMNNYLMYGRLLKTTYIPPEKQHPGIFGKYSFGSNNYPGKKNRAKERRLNRQSKPIESHQKTVSRIKKHLSLLQQQLDATGLELNIKDVVVCYGGRDT